MTATHVFEKRLVLWVCGWSLSTLHALQLLLLWFTWTMTDQRWLLHQTFSAFGKWSKGLGLFLSLGYTCTTGATCRGCTTGVRADIPCDCSGLQTCKRTDITKMCLSSLILDKRYVILQDMPRSEKLQLQTSNQPARSMKQGPSCQVNDHSTNRQMLVIYEDQKSITVLTRVHHWSQYWPT